MRIAVTTFALPLFACALSLSLPASAQVSPAEAVVATQLEAYNAHDLERFLATYADDAELLTYPATSNTRGKAEMRKRYAARFADPVVHGAVPQRIVMGNTVIDHERVLITMGEGTGVMEAVAIYEVKDGKIARVTFIPGAKTPGAKL